MRVYPKRPAILHCGEVFVKQGGDQRNKAG
jgi:hypothetical protein